MKSENKKGFQNNFLVYSLILLSTLVISQEVEEVVVSGSFIPDEKRNTSEISAVLDSSEIERTGDDNIAVALTRLTGLSLVRGKYVYVRGLGERYSAATINGSGLPSPEPLKRVVPLDLFPTQIIESSVVQKTYSADMPGEFGGGIIEINTKAVPSDRILDISFSSGYNNATSLDDGLLYDGGKDDEYGYDDGIRDFPQFIKNAIKTNRKLDRSNFKTYQLANAGREFENSKLWVIQEGEVPLDNSFNFTFGNELDIGIEDFLEDNSASVGMLFTAGMKSSWDTKDGIRQTGDIQSQGDGTSIVIRSNDKTFKSTTNDVTSYMMGVFGIETDLAELKYTGMYINKGTKEARILQGYDSSDSGNVREDFTEFFERTLRNHQLNYSYLFTNNMELDIRLARGDASRYAPYERSVFYEDTDDRGFWQYDVNTGRNQTQFSFVDDENENIGFDLTIPVELDNQELLFKVGIDKSNNNRNAQVRSYRFLAEGGPIPSDGLDNRIDYIFEDKNFDPSRLIVIENTAASSPAGYLGDMDISAAYVTVDAYLNDNFRLAAGIRNESSEQMVNTYDVFQPIDTNIEKLIDEDYNLPSFTLTYLPNFDENLQIRFGMSKTIARPTFRELSPTLFIDVDTDRVVSGSLFLENSEIDNIDLRVEYYWGFNQFLTAGLFMKDITKPIEEVVNESGDLIITSYQNVPSAELTGFEIEYERVFEDLLPKSDWGSTKEFVVKVNFTATDSEVIVNQGDTYINPQGSTVDATSLFANGRDTRLQGQSEEIANLQIGWDDLQNGSQATLIVNYVSDRVRARGIDVLPDIYEEPPLLVDFVYSRAINLDSLENDLKISLELRNILDEEYYASMADTVIYDQYNLGTSVSLGFKYSF
ncbi:MAG: TonB-dependent receptor plug domain-containing protein [Gammaproteobacteria bacterium]